MRDKKKIILIISLVVSLLIITAGVTYSAFVYRENTTNQQLVLGDIYMYYEETNQLSIDNMMPMNGNWYVVNPIMASQTANNETELSKCVLYFSDAPFDEGSDAESFCKGTGTAMNMTFQGVLDMQQQNSGSNFLESGGQQLFDLGLIILENDYYIVNPVMATQNLNELTRCINFYTNMSYEFDSGSDAESFCKGTGTAWGGVSLQDDLDDWQQNAKDEGYDFLEDGGQNLLDNGIIISNVENLPYFEFTVSGKNEYTKEDIYYEVLLSHGDVPEGKEEVNRIKDSSLRFRLAKVNEDNTETQIFTNKMYSEINNQAIWVETIKANTDDEISNKYRLYMWIDEDVTICGGEITTGCDYYTSGNTNNWSDVFASVKVGVHGDFGYKDTRQNFVELVKSKYGTDRTIVAINNDGTLYNGTGEIREYRYSGPTANNYVFFDTNGDGLKTDDEIWRIVGVFSDTVKAEDGNIVLENGQPTYEEKVKLMRNTVLTSEELPTNYNISGITYTIEDADYPGYAHRKKILSSDLEVTPSDYSLIDSDWISSGLSYYLNTEQDESETSNPGYLSFFGSKAKKLLSLTTHHLGGANLKFDGGTAIRLYESERDENNAFSDSKPNWNGYVGLLYPSDYGYSASNTYWTTKLNYYSSTAYQTSWMSQTANHNNVEVFITYSNGDYRYYSAWYWNNDNNAGDGIMVDPSLVRPVVHLISNTQVLDGAGTIEEPYTVIVE